MDDARPIPDSRDLAREIIDDLSRPIDAPRKERVSPDGQMFYYFDLMTIVDRLNEVAPGWSFEVKDMSEHPFGTTSRGQPRLLLRAQVALTIPYTGTREHIGVQVVNAESGGEDLWKGAVSDGLKKAATLFGVGKELYEDAPYEPPGGSQVNYQEPPRPVPQQQPYRPPQAQQRPQQGYQQGGGGNGLATAKQIQYIKSMLASLGLQWEDYFGDLNEFDMTMQQARGGIDGLKAQLGQGGR